MPIKMKEQIINIIKEDIEIKKRLIEGNIKDIEKAVEMIIDCYKNNKKVIIFGNGGSAADAQHFTGEMVNKFRLERKPLAALALTTDTSVLTSISNDIGYDFTFSKQIEALCNKGDIAIAITTSDVELEKGGHSTNIANALIKAREVGTKTIGLFSEKTNKALQLVDLAIKVPSKNTPRIQESHELIYHIICELVEKELFGNA
jgi:D-sedoheptulose 7-phosphate isomerase